MVYQFVERNRQTFRLSMYFRKASPHSTLQIKPDGFWKTLQKHFEFLRGELSGNFPVNSLACTKF